MLFLNLIPIVAQPVFSTLFEVEEIRQQIRSLLQKSFCYWRNKQKPPKPLNIKFHYVITDQSGVVLKIESLQLDLKKISLEEGLVWGMGSLESSSLVKIHFLTTN